MASGQGTCCEDSRYLIANHSSSPVAHRYLQSSYPLPDRYVRVDEIVQCFCRIKRQQSCTTLSNFEVLCQGCLLKWLREETYQDTFTVLATPVGLERDGEVLLKPFCPPYYRSMEAAVGAFVDYQYGAGRGTLRDGGVATAWRDGVVVRAGLPRCSDEAIAATAAYGEHIYAIGTGACRRIWGHCAPSLATRHITWTSVSTITSTRQTR